MSLLGMKRLRLLWVYCCECYHERDVNPATVPLPPQTPVPEVGKHMKCSACGKSTRDRSCTPGGIVAMRQRIRDKPVT